MKRLFYFTFLIGVFASSQSTISLQQAAQYLKSVDGIPESVTYAKDINNNLNQFVGTWTTESGGLSYTLTIKKISHYMQPNGDMYWDLLFGTVLIKDAKDTVLLNSQNSDINTDGNGTVDGLNLLGNSYVFYFVNPHSDCNDQGEIYISMNTSVPNQMQLNFYRHQLDMVTPDFKARCPNYAAYKTIFPQQKLILTKQ